MVGRSLQFINCTLLLMKLSRKEDAGLESEVKEIMAEARDEAVIRIEALSVLCFKGEVLGSIYVLMVLFHG